MTKIEKKQVAWKNWLKAYLQGIVAAFATYSTLPMPHLDFSTEAIALTLAAFPWVGVVLGILLSMVIAMAEALSLSPFLAAVLFSSVYALLTGAIHLDGLADCTDAIYSRRGKEEELRIMKDPHAGPMAIVSLVLFLLLQTALVSEWIMRSRLHANQGQMHFALILLFALSRSMSGRMVLSTAKARPDGMARMVSDPAPEGSILILDGLIILWGVLLLFLQSWRVFFLVLLAYGIYQIFRSFILKRYDGISGDLAGLFLCITELAFHAFLVIVS